MSQESFTTTPGSPPVLAAYAAIESVLAEVAHVDPGFMTTTEKQQALVAQAPVEARLAELGLRVQAAAGDVAEAAGARDVPAWLDHHNRVDRPQARRAQRLAEALEGRWRLVQAGMRDGQVSFEQAVVITRALDKLPDHITDEVKTRAEERLVAEAAHHTPRELAILGRRVLDVVAPELAEQQERRAPSVGGRGTRSHAQDLPGRAAPR